LKQNESGERQFPIIQPGSSTCNTWISRAIYFRVVDFITAGILERKKGGENTAKAGVST
jgi:hypothetical protein